MIRIKNNWINEAIYTYEDELGEKCSFKERLDYLIQSGAKFPCLFA